MFRIANKSRHLSFSIWQATRSYSTKHVNKLSTYLDIKPEIYDALHTNKKPLVALESTIITHGMPFPDNFTMALEVEEIVRQQNAIPATIAILDGKIKVGLSRDELERLANKNGDTIKTSRRDLAFALQKKLNGGTTVAATLIICNMVGIKIFATGGIGGVHRNFESTLDVSADLLELGRSPVAVVCSGVKSILDIPRTLEMLETQGVFVGAYQNNMDFPAFYTRKSGVKAPYSIKDAKEAACVIKTSSDLELNSGLLFGVPIPENFAMDETQIDNAIKEALAKADKLGVKGKEVTPFILQAISNITEGRSLAANMALIKNNAETAAKIAVEYQNLSTSFLDETKFIEKDETVFLPKMAPVIIGGSNIDTCITILDDDMKMDGATYTSKSSVCCGGVGRNLAEGVSKILGGASFISAVGNDQNGEFIKNVLHSVCNTTIVTEKNVPTANCSVLFDKFGECKLMTADMAVHRRITPELIFKSKELVEKSAMVVFDANLSVETIEAILEVAKDHDKPAFFEPTDMRIAEKPFVMPPQLYTQIKFATPNLYELRHMAHFLGFEHTCEKRSLDPAFVGESKPAILTEVKQLAEFMSNKVDNLIVTLGSLGVVVARHNHDIPFFKDSQYIEKDTDFQLRYYPSTSTPEIVNVSGAGDSFSSGLIAGMVQGLPESVCVSIGFEAAKRALMSKNAVPETYFNRKHDCWNKKSPFEEL